MKEYNSTDPSNTSDTDCVSMIPPEMVAMKDAVDLFIERVLEGKKPCSNSSE